MWPHSLLFSSDEEASRALSRAFRDLEFEVETCPEIFGAVEKITGCKFDVVVSDWNEGLEAVFLLKTSRELKANHSAFTIAIANAEATAAALDAGADLVLSRPIVPDEVKYALLTCDAFLAHMKSWLPNLGPSSPPGDTTGSNGEPVRFPDFQKKASENKGSGSKALDPVSRLRAWPSPPPARRTESASPVVAAESIFDEDLLYRSRVQTLFQVREPSFSSVAGLQQKRRSRLLPGLAVAIAFLSVGYVFSEPLRGQGTTTSVVKICGRVLERTQAWLHRPRQDEAVTPAVQVAQNEDPKVPDSGRTVGHIRVTAVKDPFQNDAGVKPVELPQSIHDAAQPASQQQSAGANAVLIPESLKMPVQSASMRSVAARITPSLLAALEPVALSEELSRRLLLQKVLPSYPEQAVKARLQGPVVLQAWIARDGSIQDLKLVRGSFLLGEAAYRAVKQWRYQPYLINGRAVEAETFITVDFRLP